MDISVIVPCYNSERYLPECLEALLSQCSSKARYEVIVIDNGSTDRSVNLIRGYTGVRLLEANRRGSYVARNVGVQAASGRILAFTDSDCAVCPTWISQIAVAMEDRHIGVILGARRFACETRVLATFADYEIEKARYVFSQDDPSVYYAYTNNMAVRREVFERHGPFVELARGADVIFVSRVLEEHGCTSVEFQPELLLRHLEISRWLDWPRKMFIYGRSYSRYCTMSRTRPLTYRHRIEILRRTMNRQRYGPARIVLLLALAATAAIGFRLGKYAGADMRVFPR